MTTTGSLPTLPAPRAGVVHEMAVIMAAAHRALQERLACEHAVVSQFPPGAPVHRENFPQRNGTMALIVTPQSSARPEMGAARCRRAGRHCGWGAPCSY